MNSILKFLFSSVILLLCTQIALADVYSEQVADVCDAEYMITSDNFKSAAQYEIKHNDAGWACGISNLYSDLIFRNSNSFSIGFFRKDHLTKRISLAQLFDNYASNSNVGLGGNHISYKFERQSQYYIFTLRRIRI